ncbi:MAG: hypothetical protein NTX03_14785 [Bacteroidetes bacterium]|nr:hypothetical protein [Bacteroidota bacterium]
MLTTIKGFYEKGKITLNEKPAITSKTKVIVTFLEEEDDQQMWKDFSATSFLKGYGENEPTYTNADIKEPNVEYKKWKKDL